MVLKKEVVLERLKELDTVLGVCPKISSLVRISQYIVVAKLASLPDLSGCRASSTTTFLDRVMEELTKYKNKRLEDLTKSLSMRWTIERGFIAAATLIFDIADHILSAKFGIYPETYADSLKLLKDKGVISPDLYQKIKGLGGFRNILVHEYLKVDVDELYENFQRCFKVFPQFSKEVQEWLERT